MGKKKQTKWATITSFPWSVLTVLLSTLALDQSAGEKSLSYYKKNIVTNYFMTLAKGSCNKNSHFLRFRRFRRFRRFCGFAVCSPQLVIFLLPCLKSWIPRLRPSWRHFLVRVLINAVKNTASSQSSTNRFLYQIKVKI